MCFETLITWNDVNGVSLFHISYVITHMAYLLSQRTPNVQIICFIFDWWMYRLFVLNTTLKRNSVQIMIFVNVCSTLRMVYIKDAFWYVNNNKRRKWCKFVSRFSFDDSYGLSVLAMDTNCPNQVYHVWLVDVQSISAKLGLETCLSPNNDIRIRLHNVRHSWNKWAFWDVNNKKLCK
jgi:hypothetical protein